MEILIKTNSEKGIPTLENVGNEEEVYVMLDGSMLYTREEGWKELKLGRIFKGKDVINIQKNRSEIMDTVYVSHLGSVKDFFLNWNGI